MLIKFLKTLLFPYKRIKELEVERDKAVAGETTLSSFYFDENTGKLTAAYKTKVAQILCTWCHEIISDYNAPNYVEIALASTIKPYETYTVTVQKNSGLTPHQLRIKAEDELNALKLKINNGLQ